MSSEAAQAAAIMSTGAAGAALVVAGGVIWSERSRRAQTADRTVLALTFPVGTEQTAATAALRALGGMRGVEVVLEIRATSDAVLHLAHVPVSRIEAIKGQLETQIPGLRASAHNLRALPAGPRAGRAVSVPRHVVLQTDDAVAASRAVLAATSHLAPGEQIALRWALRPERPGSGQSIASVLFYGYRLPDPPAAWTRKTDGAGFAARGQIIAVAASAAKAGVLAEAVASAIRSRSTSVGSLIVRGSRELGLPVTSRTSGWLSVGEILPLAGWPLGAQAAENVTLGAARQLRAGKDVPTTGRVIFTGTDSQGRRRIAQSRDAMLRHTAIVGATGSGKSTMMVSGITSDMARGFGGAVIDPKRDLVGDVLDRVDPKDAGRIAVIDPASDAGFVGIDLLGGGDPDLRADVILGALRRIFEESWGPRSDAYLRSGLRLLAEDPGASLVDWPRIYDDAGYRRRLVARLTDPIQRAEWAAFEELSAADKTNHIASPLSKITSIIGRPRVRAILAQPQPKLNIARHLESGGWVLVAVDPGPIGEAAAEFIAALSMYAVWTAVEARSTLAPEKRRPLGIYVDELASLSGVPLGLAAMFERSRGLGGAITVAAQSLARVPEPTRSALLGNAGTLVAFRSGADEAARIAREMPGLTQTDLQSLGRFEVAARVSLGAGGASRVLTGTTEPTPPRVGSAALVRARSAARFGRTLGEIEAMIAESYEPSGPSGDSPKTGRARRSA